MNGVALLKSKKATMACIAALLSFVCMKNGLTTEQTALVVSPILAYIPIEGAIDHRRANAVRPTPPPTEPKP